MADQLRKGRRFPFTIMPDWLVTAEVSDRAVRVYALIAQHANADGHAWPSRQRLAQQAGCSVDSVKRAVAELEAVGALTRTQRFGDDGSHRSNLYELHELPPDPTAELSTGGGAPVHRGGCTGAPDPGARVPHRTRPTLTRNARARSTGADLWTDDAGRVWVDP